MQDRPNNKQIRLKSDAKIHINRQNIITTAMEVLFVFYAFQGMIGFGACFRTRLGVKRRKRPMWKDLLGDSKTWSQIVSGLPLSPDRSKIATAFSPVG